MTVGEEHEQVFSKLSRYGYITKQKMGKNGIEFPILQYGSPTTTCHLDSAHLSAEKFYWNRSKMENFPKILSSRLKKVDIT